MGLDANSGNELWAVPLGIAKYDGGGNRGVPGNDRGDGPRSTPSYDSGKVYTYSGRMVLKCLDATTGKEIWACDIMKEHAGVNITWQCAASPLVEGNLVYVVGGGPGEALLAFDKNDGHVVWKAEDDKMTQSSPVAATILGERQIIFFTQKGFGVGRAGDGRGFVAVSVQIRNLHGDLAGCLRRYCLLLGGVWRGNQRVQDYAHRRRFFGCGALAPAGKRAGQPLEHAGILRWIRLWNIGPGQIWRGAAGLCGSGHRKGDVVATGLWPWRLHTGRRQYSRVERRGGPGIGEGDFDELSGNRPQPCSGRQMLELRQHQQRKDLRAEHPRRGQPGGCGAVMDGFTHFIDWHTKCPVRRWTDGFSSVRISDNRSCVTRG